MVVVKKKLLDIIAKTKSFEAKKQEIGIKNCKKS